MGEMITYPNFILPSTLTKLNCGALDFNASTKVYYNGTMAEFNAIEKSRQGNYQCWANVLSMIGKTGTIHCTDGDITVKSTDR